MVLQEKPAPSANDSRLAQVKSAVERGLNMTLRGVQDDKLAEGLLLKFENGYLLCKLANTRLRPSQGAARQQSCAIALCIILQTWLFSFSAEAEASAHSLM